jgi:hypothetical protein
MTKTEMAQLQNRAGQFATSGGVAAMRIRSMAGGPRAAGAA